ncbi:MAG: hypothetical protein ACYCOU_13435 [Sulfobacillus sp.]
MKTRTLIPILAGVATCSVLVLGATSFAASPPKTQTVHSSQSKIAWGHHRRAMKRHLSQVTQVTSTTVTVQRSGGKSQTLNLSALRVRAGIYPASSSLLAVGQRVLVCDVKSASPQLIVMPVAHGVLTQTNGSWTVVNSKETITLKGAPQQLMGLSSLAPNKHVMVFGQKSGSTVVPNVIAARPQRMEGTVISNQNGTLTVKTKANASLVINEANLPMAKWLAKIPVGHHVVVVMDPLTQKPLAVMPRHHDKMARMGRFAVGKLTSDTSQALVLQNPLGSQTVPLSGTTVNVVWKNHPNASLSQVPLGTPLLVHRTGAHALEIRVF